MSQKKTAGFNFYGNQNSEEFPNKGKVVSKVISPGKKPAQIDEELAEIRRQNQKMTEMFDKMKKAVAVKDNQVKSLIESNKMLEDEAIKAREEQRIAEHRHMEENLNSANEQLRGMNPGVLPNDAGETSDKSVSQRSNEDDRDDS